MAIARTPCRQIHHVSDICNSFFLQTLHINTFFDILTNMQIVWLGIE